MKLEDYMSYTLTEDGKPLTETQHGMDAHSEDLQALCLGMATHIEKLMRGEFICRRCGIRKDGNQSTAHEF